ncbi:hypothetical protein mru_0596 [Methanobrevibacter ruminantium M1]|uniref:Uncharacterized protein n=1 Tax=Methanobrevibacter ruminantium (strain ATCC 35063 / DSM 1093 / JCM 13430 / OCM 146 / M1) TaxID=634498 RepID=D3E1N6_METRM|nr:UbiA family prenyltransferase [Methanobrevibacter ruminantium]ADC46447.1 hypothetical protein mru_0596 [Methanobrevibacter ruminantium M1]
MVDAEKAKQPKERKNKNSNLPDIDFKALIFGAAAYAFFPLVAYQYNLDILMVFAAIGPLYIGYTAKTELKSIILGIVGATPLLYLAFSGMLGSYGSGEMADIIMTVGILGLGALMGYFGGYLYRDRQRNKAKAGGIVVEDTPKKEKQFEDTGSVKKNVANLFLPKSRRKK